MIPFQNLWNYTDGNTRCKKSIKLLSLLLGVPSCLKKANTHKIFWKCKSYINMRKLSSFPFKFCLIPNEIGWNSSRSWSWVFPLRNNYCLRRRLVMGRVSLTWKFSNDCWEIFGRVQDQFCENSPRNISWNITWNTK